MMKIILPLTAILCSLSILYSSIIDEGKRNIEVILHLDDDMTEEEQEVYIWFRTGILGLSQNRERSKNSQTSWICPLW